jgi:hypothetical protein
LKLNPFFHPDSKQLASSSLMKQIREEGSAKNIAPSSSSHVPAEDKAVPMLSKAPHHGNT